MQIVRSFTDVPEAARHGALTIGNFDGVHLGHAAVIATLREVAAGLGSPSGVMLFEPHPRQYFQPEKPLFTLTPVPQRLELLAGLGLDFAVVLPFDKAMASLPADAFVANVLVGGLAVRHVTVGYDFNFGKNRAGDGALLEEAGRRHGFGVTIVKAAGDGNEAYSSSRIRELLRRGDVGAAAHLLGRWWRLEGEVVSGAGRGSGLGFPTANLALRPGTELGHGIYATWVWIDGARHAAVSYLGTRPTFDNGAPVFETFLLDYAGDLYGKPIGVDLVAHLRADRPFANIEELKAQMQADCAEALRRLHAAPIRPT